MFIYFPFRRVAITDYIENNLVPKSENNFWTFEEKFYMYCHEDAIIVQ